MSCKNFICFLFCILGNRKMTSVSGEGECFFLQSAAASQALFSALSISSSIKSHPATSSDPVICGKCPDLNWAGCPDRCDSAPVCQPLGLKGKASVLNQIFWVCFFPAVLGRVEGKLSARRIWKTSYWEINKDRAPVLFCACVSACVQERKKEGGTDRTSQRVTDGGGRWGWAAW